MCTAVIIDTLKQRLHASLLRPTPSEADLAAARLLAEGIEEDGRWSDVDYATDERSAWPARRHLERTLSLARARRFCEGEPTFPWMERPLPRRRADQCLMSPHRLVVRSRSHSYDVHLGRQLLVRSGEIIREQPFAKRGGRCVLITDHHVAPLYAEPVLSALRGAGCTPTPIVVQAGEASKSMAEIARVADAMVDARLDRHGFVVALGGGVVGDLAGFAASIYYRGIPFVQIPTTVIAQVDSAIGGKTGVNTRAGKNLLGTFYPPSVVIADLDSLDSLPQGNSTKDSARSSSMP